MFSDERDGLAALDLGSLPRTHYKALLVGKSREIAARHLEQEGVLRDPEVVPIAEQIQALVYHGDGRRRFVAAAAHYLKEKQPSLEHTYDVVVVGAGVHAASFLHTLRRRHPHLSVLLLERSHTGCSNFAKLGDSLVLNSPTHASVGLNANLIQGHFLQLSDFDELIERPFPTAKHLYELTTMVLFHSDAAIAFDFDVQDVQSDDDAYLISSAEQSVRARSVVIANGLSDPAGGKFAPCGARDDILYGDDFIVARCQKGGADELIRGKRVAVIGAGDTANCVMEHLLPLRYPHQRYGFAEEAPFSPHSVLWIGQQADNVKDFFFENKQRYCHSGGIIEFFWNGETPFELSGDSWRHAKTRIECIPDRLIGVARKGKYFELLAGAHRFECDLIVDCTGRSNPLSARLLARGYEFVTGTIVFHGGQWDEVLEQFVTSPRHRHACRLACRLAGEHVFLLGGACPLDELIGDDEARNGAFKHQEQRASLTNSKWSLEHTLPRTVALAEKFDQRIGQPSPIHPM